MSVPITRIVCGLTAKNGLPWSVSPMSASFPLWICDEISNSTKLRTIQASATMPTHFRTGRSQPAQEARARFIDLVVRALRVAPPLVGHRLSILPHGLPAKTRPCTRLVTVEAIGVDLGGTKMLVGVVGPERNVAYRASATSMGLGQDELLSTLERELGAAVDARPEVAAIGLGLPCTIDRERGVAVMAVNLQLADVPIRDLMSERLGLPVTLDNDANAAI